LVEKLASIEEEKENALEIAAIAQDEKEAMSQKLAASVEKFNTESSKHAVDVVKSKEEALLKLATVEEANKSLLHELDEYKKGKKMAPEAAAGKKTEEVFEQLTLAEKEKESFMEKLATAEKEKCEALRRAVEAEEAIAKTLHQINEKQGLENGLNSYPSLTYNDELDDNFNEQDEALLAVNSMLRDELEEITGELNQTKKNLQKEKEIGHNDLKAFSEALKGVDELRMSAEVMSRELQRVKQKERRKKGIQMNDDDSDDMTIATVATATLDNAAKILNRHDTQKNKNPLWAKLAQLKTNFLTSVVEEF